MTPEAKPSVAGEDARVARTRADVARAALEVLTQEDWDAVTHARVAEKAGYSKTTLYAHWPLKVDLVAMALDAIGELPHHDRTERPADRPGRRIDALPDRREGHEAGPDTAGHGANRVGRADGPAYGKTSTGEVRGSCAPGSPRSSTAPNWKPPCR